MSAIQIKGLVCVVSDPYKEGHVMTAGEAQALNAMRAKNIKQIAAHRNVFTNMNVRDIVSQVDKNYKFLCRSIISSVDTEIRRVAVEIVERRHREQLRSIDPLEMEEEIQEEMERKEIREEGIRRAQIGQEIAKRIVKEWT